MKNATTDRFEKKLAQINELIQSEKRTGKSDKHSRAHLARDLAAFAIADSRGGTKSERV